MTRGHILDRPLDHAWLDAAMRIGGAGLSRGEARQRLELLLRDAQLAPTARKKTVTALGRVWIEPADAAVAVMLGWAAKNLYAVPDTRPVHLAALLAAYPFFGDVCAAVGRALALGDAVNTPDLRQRIRGAWGHRRSIDVAVQRAVKTLRGLGVLSGTPGASTSQAGARLTVPRLAGGWTVHALMLTRGIASIEQGAIRSAPELFGLALPTGALDAYPMLERHTEGGGRIVYANVVLAEEAAPLRLFGV
jgi:hypothetical protein